MRESAQTKDHGEFARQCAVRGRGNDVNASFGVWSFIPIFIMLLGKGQAAAASSQDHSDFSAFLQAQFVGRIVRVCKGFARRSESERNGARHMLAILCAELRFPIEVRNLGRYFYR